MITDLSNKFYNFKQVTKRIITIRLTNFFKEKEITRMAKYVCQVCGYVHEGNSAPEACPVCKAPASKFTEQDWQQKRHPAFSFVSHFPKGLLSACHTGHEVR